MSIERCNAAQLMKDGLPFTTVPNVTVEYIKNMDALAIWIYLQTKPSSWVIYKQEVAKHFGIGIKKCQKAFLLLEELGLLTVKQERSQDGQFSKNIIHLHDLPKGQNGLTAPLGQKRSTVNDHLVINNNNKEIINNYKGKTKKAKKLVNHEIPDDFSVSDKIRQAATENGWPDPDKELVKFINHAKQNARKCVRWEFAFRNWLVKGAEKLEQLKQGNKESRNGRQTYHQPTKRNWWDNLSESLNDPEVYPENF